MGCTNCSTGGGTPGGCRNNGTCSSGGCNKLGVFDWLSNMTLPGGQAPYDIVEIRFKNSRKSFYRNDKNLSLQVGDVVAVEASPGFDVGVVSVVGELARIQVKRRSPNLKPLEIRKILRIANQEDIDKWIKARDLEREVMYQSRTLAVNLGLEMKISDVEYQGDLSKATFYYTAETRVDFRQLIKDMAEHFRIRIEMRQIGSRQEAQRLGGIGSCGRELCCSTWLTDFRTVSTSAARYQQLSLNPQKLAGQCGKLKCCLNYELDMYLDAIKSFPVSETRLHTEKGTAFHVKTDVFKQLMWYMYDGGSGLIALKPQRVAEIKKMNEQKQKPADLMDFVEAVEVVEPDYTNVVGQDSLNRFDSQFKKKKKKKKKPGAPGQAQAAQGSGAQNNPQAKPQQRNQQPQQRAQQQANQEARPQQQKKQEQRPQQPKANQEARPRPEGAEGEQQKRPNNKRRRPNRKPGGGAQGQNPTAGGNA